MTVSAAVHGPSVGYGNEAKAALRDWVWSRVGGWLGGKLYTGPVLLMPSQEGHEIRHLLERRFTPDQLHVCDKRPAVVATLQRQFPGIHTYGVSVERACQRIAKTGVALRGTHLDFCGKLNRPLLRVVSDCWDSGALDRGWVFITVLRGREDPFEERICVVPEEVRDHFHTLDRAKWWASDDGLEPTPKDVWRLYSLSRCLQSSHSTTKDQRYWTTARAYVSPNGQSFLTVVYEPPDRASFPEQQRSVLDRLLDAIPAPPV